VTLALFGISFSFEASVIRAGLDNSWIFALNRFFEQGIAVGRDVVFTYGPLGFIVYPQPLGRNLQFALAVHVVIRMSAAFVLAAAFVLREPQSRARAAVAFVVVLLLLGFGGAPPFGVLRCALIIVVALVLIADAQQGLTLFLTAAPFAAFLLLTKAFYGAAALSVFGASTLLRLFRRERWWQPLVGAASAVVLSLFIYFGMYSTVRGYDVYLRSILEMSRGYFTAMPSLAAIDTPWLIGVPLCAAGAAWFCRRERPALTALVLFLPTLYFGLRYGVAKQPREFLAVWTVASLVVLLQLPRLESWARVAAPLLAGLYFFNLHENTGTLGRWRFDALEYVWGNTVLRGPRELRDKLFDFAAYRDHALRASRVALATEGAIDAELRERLMPHSIDSYPHELVWIAANGLSWRPRPVPQSYASNTPWLDGLDADFLNGARAPDLYLWETSRKGVATLTGLDNRLILNDEPHAALALLRHYRVTDWTTGTNAPFLVLERSPKPLLGDSRLIASARARMNEWVSTPPVPAGILRARVTIGRTLFGSIARTLWYEPKTMIQYVVTGEDKEWVEERRLAVDNAALGIWVSPFLSDLTGRNAPGKVRAFRINPSAPSRFTATYDVEWELTEVEQVAPPDWRATLR
jgi:hypothetical protein